MIIIICFPLRSLMAGSKWRSKCSIPMLLLLASMSSCWVVVAMADEAKAEGKSNHEDDEEGRPPPSSSETHHHLPQPSQHTHGGFRAWPIPSSSITAAKSSSRWSIHNASANQQHQLPASTKSNSSSSSHVVRSSKMQVQKSVETVVYHMGPVLTSDVGIYIIWYGNWVQWKQSILIDFLSSISSPSPIGVQQQQPSVEQWWRTVTAYQDQTGHGVTGNVKVAGQTKDPAYSHGKSFTQLNVQSIIRSALIPNGGLLPVDAGGVYVVLTADDVYMQDFCSSACGFHYFTYTSIVGYTLPFVWVGNSDKMCPGTCAYPFAVPSYMQGSVPALKAPNGDVGVDGMVSVLGHELAETFSNPFINAWYAGQDPSNPTEIADLCEGVFGPGAGGGYPGWILKANNGVSYNMNGFRGRRFLVQWLWSYKFNACSGPSMY